MTLQTLRMQGQHKRGVAGDPNAPNAPWRCSATSVHSCCGFSLRKYAWNTACQRRNQVYLRRHGRSNMMGELGMDVVGTEGGRGKSALMNQHPADHLSDRPIAPRLERIAKPNVSMFHWMTSLATFCRKSVDTMTAFRFHVGCRCSWAVWLHCSNPSRLTPNQAQHHRAVSKHLANDVSNTISVCSWPLC